MFEFFNKLILFFYIYVYKFKNLNKQVKEDIIDSILLANWYLIKCKSDNNIEKTEMAKRYLLEKVKKAITERSKSKSSKVIILN